MAGNIKTNSVTLGDSATDSQNFQLRTNVDGTATLARGAAGNLGDVLTVDASGKVSLPGTVIVNNGPCFSAYQSVAQSILSGTFTKVQLQFKEYDSTGAFDNTVNYRFQPNIAGYYIFHGGVYGSVPTPIFSLLYKNGAEAKRGSSTTQDNAAVSGLIYLNGTTDYVELYVRQSSGATITSETGVSLTYFQGFLARSA